MEILEALEAFSVTLPSGAPFSVSKGDRFYADDPVVQGREKLFGELKVRSSQPAAAQRTETATAAPDERRSPQAPAKPTRTSPGTRTQKPAGGDR